MACVATQTTIFPRAVFGVHLRKEALAKQAINLVF